MGTVTKIIADEHSVLFDAIEAGERLLKTNDADYFLKEIGVIVALFETFTRKFHHPKEEKILYPLLLKKKDSVGKKILKQITTSHHSFDLHLNILVQIKASKNTIVLKRIFKKYLKSLHEHIWKENIIVLVNVDYLLTKEESDSMLLEFKKIDNTSPTKKAIKLQIAKWVRKINKVN